MPELFLRDVELGDRRVDVRLDGGVVTEIGSALRPGPAAEVVDGAGGALLPGLHDHHIHLLATAAARESVAVGPDGARNADGLAAVLRRADAALPPGRWLRAVGYHESVAGPLDRAQLDVVLPRRPARLQHRTGAMWILNTAAIEALQLDGTSHPGAERDTRGQLTGRFYRADAWLRDLLPPAGPPDLAALGADLARHGITGVTDATPFGSPTDLDALADGTLPQRVTVMGGIELVDATFPPSLARGPVKLVIDDRDDPALDTLAAPIALAHRHARPVAIHCVTRVAVVLALAAWEAAGSHPGDRIEHGSVIPPDLRGPIADLQLSVVTQPAFVSERGDQYLDDVDPDDLPHLYPCRSLIAAGIPVAASSDAPYTAINPWAAMRAAVQRRTPAGRVLNPDERVDARTALDLFLGGPEAPAIPRQVQPGSPADLCLLDRPLPSLLASLADENDTDLAPVLVTITTGRTIADNR